MLATLTVQLLSCRATGHGPLLGELKAQDVLKSRDAVEALGNSAQDARGGICAPTEDLERDRSACALEVNSSHSSQQLCISGGSAEAIPCQKVFPMLVKCQDSGRRLCLHHPSFASYAVRNGPLSLRVVPPRILSPFSSSPELNAGPLDQGPTTQNAAPERRCSSAVQAIDSRECLDTVGPLPGENSHPVSAAGMLMGGGGGASPGKLVATAVTSGEVAIVPGLAVVQASPLKDGDTVEVVIHEPPPLDSRWDPVRRNSGDASTTAFAMHPLIQVRPPGNTPVRMKPPQYLSPYVKIGLLLTESAHPLGTCPVAQANIECRYYTKRRYEQSLCGATFRAIHGYLSCCTSKDRL